MTRPGSRLRRQSVGWSIVLASVALQCASPSTPPDWATVDTLIAEQFPDVPAITTTELAAALHAPSPRVVLLDVRGSEEYAVSHLRGAFLVASVDEAAARVTTVPPDAMIVAYCAVGYRSARLVAALRQRGITNVSTLQGSIFAWANEDRPLYRNEQRVYSVHPFDDHWGALLHPDRRAQAEPRS